MEKTAFISIVDSQEKHDAYIKEVTSAIQDLNILMKQEVDEFNAGVDSFNTELENSNKTPEQKQMKKYPREYTSLDTYEFIFLTLGEINTTQDNERVIRFLPDNDIELALENGIAPFNILNAARHLASGDTSILFYLCSCELGNITAQLLKQRIYPFETNPVIGVTGVLGEEDETSSKDAVLKDLQKATSVPVQIFEDKCCVNGERVRFLNPKKMAVRKTVFDAVGGFMEGAERPDIQFACRTQLMGYTLIVWNE